MRLPIPVVCLAAATALSGCVTTGTYEKKEAEAAGLAKDLRAEQERRARTQSELEVLKAQLDQIALDVTSLKAKIQADEQNLSQKEAELRASHAHAADLQALVDELSTSKKKLEAAKAELEKKSAEYEQLAGALRGEIESGRVELSELRGRTSLKMKDRILFASGSATIGSDGRAALKAVAQALRGVQGKVIRVEGHTDNVPTAGTAYPTNWELSAARALAVVRFLQECGVDPTRLAAAANGEFRPVAPNDTPEGRSQNRRIEIVLAAPEDAPAPAAPSTRASTP